jgi:16S rRNA (uracil1498-N3)-methyltransferase
MQASSPNRLYHAGPLAAGTTVRLDADASHHALRVLRLAAGDAVELFDGGGLRWPGRLVDADPRAASVALGEPVDAATESPLAIGLAQGLPAGDKMDWVVEKAVELGVAEIQPLLARRSVMRLDAERAARKLAHWRRIAVAACMQCGRDRIPVIREPLALARWLDGGVGVPGAGPAVAAPERGDPAGPGDAPLRLVLSPRGTDALATLAPSSGGVWLLAGPESGLADDEEARATAAGWRALRLGPRVLRTETAGLASIAALQARFGDF